MSATREDWIALGDEIKRARALLMEINEMHRQASGNGKASLFGATITALDRAKWELEGSLGYRHPEWHDVSHFFSGPSIKS